MFTCNFCQIVFSSKAQLQIHHELPSYCKMMVTDDPNRISTYVRHLEQRLVEVQKVADKALAENIALKKLYQDHIQSHHVIRSPQLAPTQPTIQAPPQTLSLPTHSTPITTSQPTTILTMMQHDNSVDEDRDRVRKKRAGNQFRVMKKNAIDEKDVAYDELIQNGTEILGQYEDELTLDKNGILTITNSEFERLNTDKKNTTLKVKNSLERIRKVREQLLGIVDCNEYTTVVQADVTRLQSILKAKKYKVTDRDNLIMTNGLNCLEARLITGAKFHMKELEPDYIQRYEMAMKLHHIYSDSFIPFNLENIINYVCNYGLCMFSIEKILRMALTNVYGINNIIYVDLDGDTDDPWSFYTLGYIENDVRHWKLDIRLERLTQHIIAPVREYSIHLFRKMYASIFNDNMYRNDYKLQAVSANNDLEQLLLNIIYLGKPKKLCNFIRYRLREKNAWVPTNLDKFNLRCDDTISKKEFQNKTDDNEEIRFMIGQLFDDISDEDIRDDFNL